MQHLQAGFLLIKQAHQKARNKGTCSITNYDVSEEFRNGHGNSKSYSIYAYPVPVSYNDIMVGNTKTTVRNKHAYAYETVWLEQFENFNDGDLPRLSKNKSVL